MVLADITTSFLDSYGPYAFGVGAVVILVLLGLFVTTKGLMPLFKVVYDIQTEQTKQTTNLREAAMSHERTTANLAAHSEHLVALSQIIKGGSGTTQRPA
jgi:p-aminobenzoyl-glutamate transporter AbgT